FTVKDGVPSMRFETHDNASMLFAMSIDYPILAWRWYIQRDFSTNLPTSLPNTLVTLKQMVARTMVSKPSPPANINLTIQSGSKLCQMVYFDKKDLRRPIEEPILASDDLLEKLKDKQRFLKENYHVPKYTDWEYLLKEHG